ncbi:hypothetical protein BASA83_012548 [Batrachochytrium salamandrivorans]|nr:hypothetical protein BASA83_012548 [Batrachochytrium salamandrivorans]
MAKQIWTSVGWTGTVEHESMGTRHDNRALAARLADFLQNLSQQFAAQQTELATLSNAFALQQKTIADLEKINRDLEKVLSNMASQMTSTNEDNSNCSCCHSSQTGSQT